jgi:ribose-phosphate pyrophosphokinase
LHAAPLLADWVSRNVDQPVLLGPDSESRQWVASVAEGAKVPFAVMDKVRHGDRDVSISAPDVQQWQGRTPVLVDDIIASGHTMLETLRQLRRAGLRHPTCLGVHGLFAEGAFARLLQAGAARIVTTNAVAHESNAIDLAPLLASAVRAHLG